MYHAQHKSTGMNLALKCYLRDKVDPLTLSQIRREIDIHAVVSHPAITNFYGSFEDDRGNIYLLHEYAKKGDVFGQGHIHSPHVLKPTTLRRHCFKSCISPPMSAPCTPPRLDTTCSSASFTSSEETVARTSASTLRLGSSASAAVSSPKRRRVDR